MTGNNRKNVIVFLTDQQRADTLGVAGCKLNLTPHMDRLARGGTYFRAAVTPQPVCGPARSCLQTGQYATTTGVWRNGPGLREESPQMAREFAQAGYRTGYIGKWHLSENTGEGPVPEHNRSGYQDWLAANCIELTSGPNSLRLWNNDGSCLELPGYRSDAVIDAAIRYVHERSLTPDVPFFLFISLLEPHHQNTDDSYPAPRGMENQYRDTVPPPDLQALGGSTARDWAGYCAMIKRLDDGLGRLVDAVESLNLGGNTMMAFASDHGCHFKTRNSEYKRSPHEASVRVPLVLWGPGWNGGGQHDVPASLVDLAPSLLDSAGLSIPDSVQGVSLLPVTKGEQDHLPSESFIQFGDGFLPPGRALRNSRWKYAVTATEEHTGVASAPAYQETHLFDLRTDPHELSNLVGSAAHQAVRDELRERLLKRMAEIGEPATEIESATADSASTQRTINYPGED